MPDYSAFQATVVDSKGNVLDNASVEVRNESDDALSTIYETRTGTAESNPLTTDANGFFRFYAGPGAYKITATKGGQTITWRHVALGLGREYDSNQDDETTDTVIYAQVRAASFRSTSSGGGQLQSNNGTLCATFGGGGGDNITFPNVDINGGAIDGAIIGANSAAAITGTTGTFSGDVVLDGGDLIIEDAVSAVIRLRDTGAPTDEGNLRILSGQESFRIISETDGFATGNDLYRIFRNGLQPLRHEWGVGTDEDFMQLDANGLSFDGGTNSLSEIVNAGTSFNAAMGAVTVTIGTDNSRYERIGNQCFVEFDFSFSALDTTDASVLSLGLPEFLANANFVQGNIDTRYSTGIDLSSAGEVYFSSNGAVGGIGLVFANGNPMRYNTGELQTSGNIRARVQYTTS